MWFAGGAESGTVQEYSGMPLASSVTLSRGERKKSVFIVAGSHLARSRERESR